MDANRATPLVSGGLVVGSMLLPWWDGDLPLTLRTHTPKAILATGILMLVVGALWDPMTGRRNWMALTAPFLMLAAFVAFYAKVDDSKFFPELPFTLHIEFGFFVALVGLAFAGLTVLLVLMDWLRPSVRRQGESGITGPASPD